MYQRKLGTMKERKVHNHYVVVLVPYSQCIVIMTIALGAEIIFCSPGYCHGWRWRELNSRPTKHAQVFSGCSPFNRCFRLQRSHEQVADELSHVSFSSRPVTNVLSSGFLKRRQAPRRKHPQTDGFRSSLRRRGRNRCAFQWHLLVYRESLTR